MTEKSLAYSVLFGGLIAWRFYRKFRAQVGPQVFRPRRLGVSALLFSLSLCVLGFMAFRGGVSVFWILGGAAAGVALGATSLRLTRFDFAAEPRRYTPNPYLGAGIVLLLVGRVVYSLILAYSAMRSGLPAAPPARSPLTAAVAALVLAFYVSSNALLLLKFNAATAAAVDQA